MNLESIKAQAERDVAEWIYPQVKDKAVLILKLCAALEKAIEQRNYVADYPIDGIADIEIMNAELTKILEGDK